LKPKDCRIEKVNDESDKRNGTFLFKKLEQDQINKKGTQKIDQQVKDLNTDQRNLYL
jgi:hypothetical protein